MRKIAFVNGSYYNSTDPHISTFDRAIHFGDACYETIFFYHKPIVLEQHLGRMRAILQALCITPPPALNSVEHIIQYLMTQNAPRMEGYAFVCVTAGALTKRNLLDRTQGAHSIIVQAFPYEFKHLTITHANFCIENRWASPELKCTSLIANTLAAVSTQGHTIYQKPDGWITEGTHYNIFIVTKDGAIATTPADGAILPGCTRAIVMEIIRTAGLSVEERPIHRDEVLQAQEVFGTSSIMHIGSIERIENVELPKEKPITQTIRALYDCFIKGHMTAA